MMKSIPPMTHPLSKAWDQPPISNIFITPIRALMSEKTFKMLHEYSMSTPSGVYEGKMWKAKHGDDYYLCWYDKHPHDPDKCKIEHLKILVE